MDRYQTAARSVLIVDDSRDSREVLRAVLELRGWNIIEADGACDGLEKAATLHPDVIVVDAQSADAAREMDASFDDDAPLVIIGQAKYNASANQRSRVVAKPYHYAPLVRTIDELAASVLAKAG